MAGQPSDTVEAETPPELLPQILTRGAQILSPPPLASSSRPETQISWWQRLSLVWRHPLVVGPVTAAVCFLAGVWSAPYLPNLSGSSSQVAVQTRDVAPSVASDAAPVLSIPAFDTSPSESAKSLLKRDRRDMPERRRAPAHYAEPEQYKSKDRAMPARPAMRMASSAQQSLARATALEEVTFSLPVRLYEQVQRESRQRNKPLVEILRDAIEAYMRNQHIPSAATSESPSQPR